MDTTRNLESAGVVWHDAALKLKHDKKQVQAANRDAYLAGMTAQDVAFYANLPAEEVERWNQRIATEPTGRGYDKAKTSIERVAQRFEAQQAKEHRARISLATAARQAMGTKGMDISDVVKIANAQVESDPKVSARNLKVWMQESVREEEVNAADKLRPFAEAWVKAKRRVDNAYSEIQALDVDAAAADIIPNRVEQLVGVPRKTVRQWRLNYADPDPDDARQAQSQWISGKLEAAGKELAVAQDRRDATARDLVQAMVPMLQAQVISKSKISEVITDVYGTVFSRRDINAWLEKYAPGSGL